MHSTIRRGLFQISLGICLVSILSAFMVPIPKEKKAFMSLPLPPGITLSDHLLFAGENARNFLFFDPKGPPVLHYLRIDHPMGSRHFLHEQWVDLPLPAPETLSRIRALAIEKHSAYLSGSGLSGEPILRMLHLSPRKNRILGYTDFMPRSGGTPIREIVPDNANGRIWLTFDNGQINAGHSMLLTPETILSASPEETLTEKHRKVSPDGPELMPTILKSRIEENGCISCRLFLIKRNAPAGKSVTNVPLRAPIPIDLSMGMIPIGLSGALFAGDPSTVCHLSSSGIEPSIGPCHPISTRSIPSDGILWGSQEVFLLRRPEQSSWHLAVVNREWLEDPVARNRPLSPDFPMDILKGKANFYRFRDNTHPIPGFWSAGTKKVVLFGHRHIYLLFPEDQIREAPHP